MSPKWVIRLLKAPWCLGSKVFNILNFIGVGESVAEDEVLCSIETDKVTVDLRSPIAGTILELKAEAGSTVAVQDSGPGVPDYALPRLGERFFTTARPGGERSGSGLGLAIVRRVMALHGGQMVVRNTAPGLRVELEFRAA